MSTTFHEFIASRTVTKSNGVEITHTRMPDRDLGIFGGSFNIPQDMLPTFYKLYRDFIAKGGKEYLTEKQRNGNCIAIDLDFRYNSSVTEKQHTAENITDCVCEYVNALHHKYLKFDENTMFDVFVFEKPEVNRLADGSLTKDGIHIIIGLKLEYPSQLELRRDMLKELPNVFSLPLTNTWESVLDEGISKGTTNWTLYGSQKPGNQAYRLTRHFVVTFDPRDSNIMMDEANVADFDLEQNFSKLSVQYSGHQDLPRKMKLSDSKPISRGSPTGSMLTSSPMNDYVQKYRDYASIINRGKYFEPYDKWYKFQRASANIGIAFEVYDEFMVGCLGYDQDKNREAYLKPEDNKNGRLGWGYIYEIAKESNPEMKNELDAKYGKANFCKFKFAKLSVDESEYADKAKEVNDQIDQLTNKTEDLKAKIEELKAQNITSRDLEKELAKREKDNSKLIKELEDKLDKVKEDALYAKRKRYFEKFHFKLMNKVCYCRFKEDGFEFLTEEKLLSLYRYFNDFIKRWISDIQIREYEDVDFQPPPIPTKRDVFNLFTGLEYEKTMGRVMNLSDDELRENSQVFIKHLWYLSGKNNAVLDYCLKYLAHIVQETGNLPRTSIVFKSEQGCGKNIFFENFAEKILGEQYLLATANLDNIIGRFPMISKRLLILMDETNGKESFLGSDRIKSFITAKTIPFEQKGIDPIMIKNCSRMIFFTNNDYPVKIEQSDRRFVVAECSNDIKNNTVYFKALLEAFGDKVKTASFGLFLKKLDISAFDPTNDRPITKLYKEIQTATVPAEVRYFVEREFDEAECAEEYSGEALYSTYVFWCENHKKRYKPITKQTFLTRIKKHDFIHNRKDSKGCQVYTVDKARLDEFKEEEKRKEDMDDDTEDTYPY